MSLKEKFSWDKMRVSTRVGVGVLVFSVLWLGIWGWRVYRTTRSLLARLPALQVLLDSGDPLAADPAELTDLVTGVRADVVALKREVGWLVPLAPAFRWLPQVGPLLGDASEWLVLGDTLTELGVLLWVDVAPALTALQNDTPAVDALVAVLPDVVADASAAQALAAEAEIAYMGLDVAALPTRFQGQASLLGEALPLLNAALAWVEVAPALLGVDVPYTYLLLVLNEDELRAGGGFITGVGELQIAKGRVVSMTFGDSYAADDFTQPYPDPPAALRYFLGVDLWVFRDSNWSPDFPTATRQALELYHPGHTVAVDGVIAVNQYAAQQLVGAVGPLQVAGTDAPITGKTLLPYIYGSWVREDDEGFGEWWLQRKAFMGHLAEAGMAQVLDGKADMVSLAKVGFALLEEKHILLYFEDAVIESRVQARGWGGHLPEREGDYVMVVESNIGYNKASAAITRTFDYVVDVRPATPVATLTLTYSHTSRAVVECLLEPRYDETYVQMRDRCYWAHIRAYVPEGARLLSASQHPIPAEFVAARERWPGEASLSPAPEGAWSVLAQAYLMRPQEQTVVTFTYTLPPVLVEEAGTFAYHLTWVKQAGLRGVPVRVVLLMPQNAVLLQPSVTAENTSSALFKCDSPHSAEDGGLFCQSELGLDRDVELWVRYLMQEVER